jgi:hypothetical protein
MSTAQSNLNDSVFGAIEEANKDVIVLESDELHRKYPERYRLQAT